MRSLQCANLVRQLGGDEGGGAGSVRADTRACQPKGVRQTTDHEAEATADDCLGRQLATRIHHHIRVLLVHAAHKHPCIAATSSHFAPSYGLSMGHLKAHQLQFSVACFSMKRIPAQAQSQHGAYAVLQNAKHKQVVSDPSGAQPCLQVTATMEGWRHALEWNANSICARQGTSTVHSRETHAISVMAVIQAFVILCRST